MTEPTRGDDEEPRRQFQAELAAKLEHTLAQAQSMHRPASRQQLVQRLRDRLHHPKLADHPDPLGQSQEVVYFCTRAALDAVSVLVAEVAALEGRSDQVRELHQLRDEWEACEGFLPEDWQLRSGLAAVRPPHLTRLYQRASGQPTAPWWCAHAWHMFVHLAGGNAGAGGLTPGTEFLALLEPEVDPPLAALIRRRNQLRAAADERTAELDQLRFTIEGRHAPPASATVYLLLQLAPDLAPDDDPDAADRYWLSLHFHWHSGDQWQRKQHGGWRTVHHADLRQEVAGGIQEMESALADELGAVVVEVVLPRELLNIDVEWWPLDANAVLAMEYPVVVRSLERLHAPWSHRRWRRRWWLFQQAPGSSQVYWSEPLGFNHLQRLEAALRADERWVALVPSEPPAAAGDTGQLEVTAAVSAGLPVVIWHRQDCRDDAFREAVDRLTAGGGLAQLPIRLRRLRLDAMLDPEQRADHVGRHITVLWDDPDRLPDTFADPST